MNHAILSAPAPRPRRGHDWRVNLSSNELIHPAVPGLIATLVDGFDPALLARYPVQVPAAESAAQWLGVPAAEILIGPGSDSIIRLLLTSLRDAYGGRLILQSPNYEAWTSDPRSADWLITSVLRENGHQWWERLTRAAVAADGPGLVVTAWPNGPAGDVCDIAALHDLRAVCEERGHLLVVDACYAAFSGDPLQMGALRGPASLVLLSWSKMFGLAGGRLAVAMASAPLVSFLRGFRQEDHVNALMLWALQRTPDVHTRFAEIWREVIARREAMVRRLRWKGLSVETSGGNFLNVDMGAPDRAAWLAACLDATGYRVRDLSPVLGLEGRVRFTVACGIIGDRFLATLEEMLTTPVGSERGRKVDAMP